jgi:hemerythrin-like metal-binding protein
VNLLVWTQQNSVGVKELDAHHQEIFTHLNSLYTSISKFDPKDTSKDILQKLTAYAKYHFAAEEKYFAKFNYENTDLHNAQHRQYENKMNQFITDIETKPEFDFSYDLLDFLEDWWLGHINNEDKKYTHCFNSHGLF